MKAVIAFQNNPLLNEIAQAIATGAQTAGVQTQIINLSQIQSSLEPYDLLFIGITKEDKQLTAFIESLSSDKPRAAAIFYFKNEARALQKIMTLITSKNVPILETIAITPPKGFFFKKQGNPEQDLARATGFGEKLANRAQNKRSRQESEKQRIEGYLK